MSHIANPTRHSGLTPYFVCAGAVPKAPPADMFWGDRVARVRDPFGHHWTIATHQRDVSHEEIARAMQ